MEGQWKFCQGKGISIMWTKLKGEYEAKLGKFLKSEGGVSKQKNISVGRVGSFVEIHTVVGQALASKGMLKQALAGK